MVDITVPVPQDRTAEFYQFFGLWLAGSLAANELAHEDLQPRAALADGKPRMLPWGSSEQDYVDAERLWKKYSKSARAMFSLLIDNPDKRYTGDQIATEIGIKHGARGVAGLLAWPGRHGAKIGRGLPSEWGHDEDTSEGSYWIPADRAEAFKAARAKVEGAA